MVWLKDKKGRGSKPTTKNTVPNKALVQNQWRNQKFYRRAKAKTIQYNQTSFTTNPKGISLGGKEKGTRKLQMGKLISKGK